jgi:hypothetical protein
MHARMRARTHTHTHIHTYIHTEVLASTTTITNAETQQAEISACGITSTAWVHMFVMMYKQMLFYLNIFHWKEIFCDDAITICQQQRRCNIHNNVKFPLPFHNTPIMKS